MPTALQKIKEPPVPDNVVKIRKFLDRIPAKTAAPYFDGDELSAKLNVSSSRIFQLVRHPLLKGYSKKFRRKLWLSNPFHIGRL